MLVVVEERLYNIFCLLDHDRLVVKARSNVNESEGLHDGADHSQLERGVIL